MGRLRSGVLLLAALAAVLSGVGAASPPVSEWPVAGSAYVALGDSYAAGYGLPDPTGQPVPACGQSAHDYPHRVAEQLRLRLTDESCASATSADVRSGSDAGPPAQVAALGPGTRTVTLTIGGNDAGLFSQAFSCLALTAHGPVIAGHDAASCRSRFVHDGTDTLRTEITGTIASDLARTLGAVRRAAPNAVVVVVGYPTIFPDRAHTPAGGCFRPALTAGSLTGTYPADSFPFTDVDVPYFHTVQERLDAVMRSAASRQHVAFVSMLSRTAAHSACATDDPYIAGLRFRSPKDVEHVDLAPGALHPNEQGAAALAAAAVQGIRTAYRERAAAERPPAAPGTIPPVPLELLLAVLVAVLVAGWIVAGTVVLRRRRRDR